MPSKNSYPLIDIGANLGHDSFSADLEQIIDEATQAGIEHIMVTGTSLEGSHAALAVAEKYTEFCSSTAGVHPHEAENYDDQTAIVLRELAAHSRVKAMGETGLDYFRDYSPRDVQQRALEGQLQLAADLHMPVFLHQREGHEDFIRLLREYRNALPRAVVHCFTGTESELRDYLELDMYIGVTGWICDERRGHHLHEFIHLIPENRLMLETDAPYLLPRTIQPKPKSRRNVPANLVYVLAKVAECLGKTEKNVAEKTSRNARDFFVL